MSVGMYSWNPLKSVAGFRASRYDDAALGFLRGDYTRGFFRKLREKKLHKSSRLRASRSSAKRQTNQKYHGPQHIRILQTGIADVFLLGLAVLLEHVFHFSGDPLLRRAGNRLFIMQDRIH